ncbi:MAG: hypothetical protein GTO14_00030 [Anaerolineales bacterium]|nr:hypothetical protein [Anaerolineales bacterium]
MQRQYEPQAERTLGRGLGIASLPFGLLAITSNVDITNVMYGSNFGPLSLVTLVVFGAAGYKYLLLPLIVAAFFDVGPGAVLANATGGVRGAILAAAIGGVLMIVIQALAVPFVLNTAAGFVNAFGGNDFGLIAIVVGGIARLLGL